MISCIFFIFQFFIPNNSFHPSNIFWPNFIGFAPILYILYCLLCDEAVISKFSYKTIGIANTLSNIYIKVILPKFQEIFLSLTLLNYLSTLLLFL